jgi:DNA-binding IclR family transcriptional regulator
MEKLRVVGAVVADKNTEFFSLDQVVELTGFERTEVRRALEKLLREKLVLKITRTPKDPTWMKGRPRLTITYHVADQEKLVERVAPRLKEDTAQDRMWTAMRYKSHADGSFTLADVITLAKVGREHARWFVKMLRRAGYVEPSKKTIRNE